MESILNEQQATLRDYLRIIFRQRSVIITTVLCVVALVFFGLQFKTPEYESKVRMISIAKKYFENTYFKDASDYRSTELTLSQSEMVKSNPVLERAVKRLRLNEQPLDYEKAFATPLKALIVDLKSRALEKKLARYSTKERNEIIFRMRLQDLKKRVKVEQVKETNLFTITAKDFNPETAAKIANAVSRSYCIFDLEQQLAELQQRYGEKHLVIMQLKDNISRMEDNLSGDNVSDSEAIGPASVKIIEQATAPFEPAGLPNSLLMVLALFLSLCLGIVLAFGLESMDSTLKTPDEIKEYLGFSLLGYIPKIRPLPGKLLNLIRFLVQIYINLISLFLILWVFASKLQLERENSVVQFLYQFTASWRNLPLAKTPWIMVNALIILLLAQTFNLIFSKALGLLIKNIALKKLVIGKKRTHSAYLRSYQNLAEQVVVSMKGNEQKSALIVSALPKAGNSLITANLGRYLADNAEHKVLLIDANLRKPALHKIFKLRGYFGLVDVLKGTLNFDESIQRVSEKLAILPCGKALAGEDSLLNFSKVPEIIKEAEKSFEFIFIDCANLRNYKDALVISAYVDTAIVIVNESSERREAVKAALSPLKERKVNFLGAILNNRTFAIPKAIYDRT